MSTHIKNPDTSPSSFLVSVFGLTTGASAHVTEGGNPEVRAEVATGANVVISKFGQEGQFPPPGVTVMVEATSRDRRGGRAEATLYVKGRRRRKTSS